MALSAPVAPNGSVTFNFPITAPANPGTYNFQWQMVQEGTAWFGAMSANVGIVVKPPAPVITVTRSPNPMTAGQTFNLNWKALNATALTRTCTSAIAGGFVSSGAMAIDASGNGSASGLTADPVWVNKPSTCTWTAAGAGGTSSIQETMTTNAAAPKNPILTVTRNPNPMQPAKTFTLNWSVTNTSTLTRSCTSTTGGFAGNDVMAFDPATGKGGTQGILADANWVNKPSTCTWTATGDGGSVSIQEIMTTQAVPTGPVVTYIHTDGLGSVVARTNEKGEVISRTRYEPYGATAGGATPTIGFTGHVNDADTGLTYMQQRYFDPIAGRFMSVDPVLTDANTGRSFNRYVYANNNPYGKVDRDGRDPEHAYVPGGMSREEYASVNADVGDKATRATLTIGRFFPQTATISAVLLGALDSAQSSTAGFGASAGTGGSPSGLDIPFRGASGGPRAGKQHTQAAKKASLDANKTKNGGNAVCPKCDKPMADPQQSKSGQPKDMSQAEGDYIIPKSQGGDGATAKDLNNIETICAQCNNDKSNK